MYSQRGIAVIMSCLMVATMTEGLASGCLGMQGEAVGPHDKVRSIAIDHETPSIGTGVIIGNHHRIEIKGSIRGDKGEGELRLDSGSTKLNEFGDIVPHRGYLATTPIKFKLLDRADPTGQGRKIYLIAGGGLERLGIECSIVTEDGSLIRLVIKDGNEHTSLPLTPRTK